MSGSRKGKCQRRELKGSGGSEFNWGSAYAGVEADGLRVHAHRAELDQLLELDGQRRHDAQLS